MSTLDVLFVHPPWVTPTHSSIAVATLSAILEEDGLHCDELHGALHFPLPAETADVDAYLVLMESFSSRLFAPTLYPELDDWEVAESVVRAYIDIRNLDGLREPQLTLDDLGGRDGALFQTALRDIQSARVCVDRCVEAALAAEPSILAFSCTFESQLQPALAIAAAVKRARPEAHVIVGGAACAGDVASELIRSFPQIDVACFSEGDQLILPLVQTLLRGAPVEPTDGLCGRHSDGTMWTGAAPPLLTDLDVLPLPTYDRYLDALARSSWSGHPPTLFFETSRGCWWGEKHLCSFCGLNADGLAFRRKSPERAIHEITTLHAAYPSAAVWSATDNILDMRYFSSVLPALEPLAAQPNNPLRVFFETKSNLRRDQVERLARAGIVYLQPGIESLSDGVLTQMDKGSTALQQVQFMKWAHERGLHLTWNVIVRNPGESLQDYREMDALLPYIEHLPPPTSVVPMMLQRFSPYFTRPAHHGIRNVTPAAYYRGLYPDARINIDRLAYQFDYDHDMFADDALRTQLRRTVGRLGEWRKRYANGDAAEWSTTEHGAIVVEQRAGRTKQRVLGRESRRLLSILDRNRPRGAISRSLPELDDSLVEAALAMFQHHRWAVASPSGRWLTVIPERQRSSGPQTQSPPAC